MINAVEELGGVMGKSASGLLLVGPSRLHPLGLGCHRLVQGPGRTEEHLAGGVGC